MDTLQSYDRLPYDRLPFPETEPDFLAALARLHGFAAGDARSARVLELGCAQGGNLIPMAARYPQSEFVGVDLSRVQVGEGNAFIAQTGLDNIRLLHGDIAALPNDLGEFDFIIAHGVYSWVPDFVREALLASCRRHLKPQGIAYISFNVEAGWRTYGQIRQLLLEQDKPELGPVQRVEQARSVLAATQFEDERLQKEADYLQRASASYLFHEYLSAINNAYPFTQFVADAAGHGLRYLGEAGPRRARVVLENDWQLSAEARYERWLEAEAKLDDALNTRFRRALLVRDDAVLPQPHQAEFLKTLAYSAGLTSDDELDFAEAGEQHFQASAGERFPVNHPLLKAFLVVLSSAYPRVIGYEDGISHALTLAREYGYSGEADEAFIEALLDFAQMQGMRLHTSCPEHAATLTGFPQASTLTRTQAANPGWAVTNIFHLALDMDEWGRRLLAAMDGSASTEMLGQQLLKGLGEAGIQATPEQAAQHVENYLEFFRRQGIVR
jgi:SAM-dependent methyltransferase